MAAAALALAIVGAGTAAAAAASPSQAGSAGQRVSAADDTTAPPTTAPETTTPGTDIPETTAAETEAPETTAPPETVPVTGTPITCETARNHGEWVSYVARTATGDTRSEQVRAAAKSDCGKKVKATKPSKPGKSHAKNPGSAHRSAKSKGRN